MEAKELLGKIVKVILSGNTGQIVSVCYNLDGGYDYLIRTSDSNGALATTWLKEAEFAPAK